MLGGADGGFLPTTGTGTGTGTGSDCFGFALVTTISGQVQVWRCDWGRGFLYVSESTLRGGLLDCLDA